MSLALPQNFRGGGHRRTARGWDTVAIVKSAASERFLQLSVLEIWGKPRV